jgi:hypothetical protein
MLEGIWHDALDPGKGRRLNMPLSFSTILLSSQMVIAVADGIPAYNTAHSCRLDRAATAGLTVDQSMKSCMSDERRARRQVASQWPKFSSTSRARCSSIEGIGGTPSYVSLQTCLQMAQWAR